MKKNTPLYDLRMEYERANSTDVKSLNRDVEKYLECNPEPSQAKLAILGGIYFMVGENIDRDSIKNRTREEWAELERKYVSSAVFTLPDLVDNLLKRLERGRITRKQLEEERRKFKPCKHRFCLDYYVPRRSNQGFCSEKCRKLEHQSLKDFEETGTYLPPSAYKETRQAEKDRSYEKYERQFEPDTLQLIRSNQELNVGKRDRDVEERKLRASRIEKEVEKYEKVVGITRKSVVKTPLNIGEAGETSFKKYSEK